MAEIKKIQKNGVDIYPVTHEDVVFDNEGISIGEKIDNINNNKADKSDIPTKLSELENDLGFTGGELPDNLVTEDMLQEVEDMLGGKSLRYVTQEEYGLLSEEEKNREDVMYFITDADVEEQHNHDNMDVLESITQEDIDKWNEPNIELPEDLVTEDMLHNHDNMDILNNISQEDIDKWNEPNIELPEDIQYKTDENLNTENKTIVGAINELDNDIFNAVSKTIDLDLYKADKTYVDSKFDSVLTEEMVYDIIMDVFEINMNE